MSNNKNEPETAVIISGHMRTFSTCIHTLRWHILRHYSNLAFYVSTVADEDAASVGVLHSLFPNARVHVKIEESQPVLPTPDTPEFEPYANSVPRLAIIRQLWQLRQAWSLFEQHATGNELQIIRVRPDLYFHSHVPALPMGNVALTPWWGRFGGVNDRFAILSPAAAQSYFCAFDNLPQLLANGCPFHPESIMRASLELGEVRVIDGLKTEFSTFRKDGNHRPPEISAIDIAHLRG